MSSEKSSVPEMLEHIHTISPLLWIDIASTLGTHTRVVHHWLYGLEPTDVQKRNLHTLHRTVVQMYTPGETDTHSKKPPAGRHALVKQLRKQLSATEK